MDETPYLFNLYGYGEPGVVTDYQGDVGPSLGLSNLYAGMQRGYNLPSDYTGPLLVGSPGGGDPVVLTNPDDIAAYKHAERTRNLQGLAKIGLLVGGAAALGQMGAGAAGAGSSGAASAAPWAGELTAAGLPTGAGIAAAPLTGGMVAPGVTAGLAAAAPTGIEEIIVHGTKPALSSLSWEPEVFSGLSSLYAPKTEIQGPPEPDLQAGQTLPESENQNWWDKIKSKLPGALGDKLEKYLKNPLVTAGLGAGLGALLANRGGERTSPKYPYYQAGGYDWRSGSFAPGKWVEQYPMASGGLVPLAGPNYPLGRVQAAGLGGYDAAVHPYTGQELPTNNFAQGGLTSLGMYSDGGQLLRGPGDGVSDNIPAVIEGEEVKPARLADGEFVIPARIVSEIGNGSTEAGARKLYQIMDAIQRDRSKTTSKGRVATDTQAERHFLGRK